MAHPLDGCFLKLSRARYHIDSMNELIQWFLDRKPYRIIDSVERDGQTRYRVLRFQEVEPIPTSVYLGIGDICNNLRSSLDFLIWQLHLIKDVNFSKNVKFPIWDSEGSFKINSPKDTRRLSDNQRTLIDSVQPYKTGNNALSILRDVNDSDKHRIIQIMNLMVDIDNLIVSLNDSRAMLKVPMPFSIPMTKISPTEEVKDGTEIARITLNNLSRGTNVYVKSHGFVKFAFKGSKCANGKLVENSINAILIEVYRIIKMFEPEFFEFGVSDYISLNHDLDPLIH